MLIPKPVANHSRNSVTPRLAQLNMNSAAIAPRCNRTSATVVGQFSFCLSGNSMMSIVDGFGPASVVTVL